MELWNQFLRILRKPFPQNEDWKSSIKTILIVSIFVTFFLYFFTPFDINRAQGNIFLMCLGFGFMTFIGSLSFDLLAKLTGFKGENTNFTFGRWILYMIGILLIISLANFLFMRLVIFGNIRWEFFHYTIRSTFLVGIFPVVGLGLWTLFRNEKKYNIIAKEINQSGYNVTEQKKNIENVVFDIPIKNIRYIEALQNYIKIGFINQNGKFEEKTERSTFKEVLAITKGSEIAKSHRSFAVNKNAIVSATGNAQGLQLTLAGIDKKIPVSRSMVSNFRVA